MNIVINEGAVDKKQFGEFKAGDLMVQDGGKIIHIKTSDCELVNLLTGYCDGSIHPTELYVDVTDKYILTNTK